MTVHPSWMHPPECPASRDAGTCTCDKSTREAGVKADDGKLRYDLIPPEALELLARAMTLGAAKYGDRNWENGLSWSRVYAAMMRHAEAIRQGHVVDTEGNSHFGAMVFNAAVLATFHARGAGIKDFRPGGEPEILSDSVFRVAEEAVMECRRIAILKGDPKTATVLPGDKLRQLRILTEEVGELAAAMNPTTPDYNNAYVEAVQVAAVAILIASDMRGKK